MLIDTHSHINFNAFKDDGDEVIKRALEQKVWMINVGSQWDTSERAVQYAQKNKEGVYAAVGLHPIHLEETEITEEELEGKTFKTRKEDFNFEKYWELAQNEKVKAIGEIGLDYKISNLKSSRRKTFGPLGERQISKIKKKQKEVLNQQLELAQQTNLPIIFHCREAYQDLIQILKDFESHCADCVYGCPGAAQGRLKGVIHCFCGDVKTAKQFLEMGFYLGFNGIITFSNQYDEIIKETALEKILLETDCPYLAPIPYRGKRNEPAYVRYIAQKIAEIQGVNFEKIAEQTTKNARELFMI